MADFRRKEYRGSLLLVQECGPVDIVVDTDAKTVTPSLAKADSSYSIAGGGGSVEYVIPEQTVTITDNMVQIQVNDSINNLADDDWIIFRCLDSTQYLEYFALVMNNNIIMYMDYPMYMIGKQNDEWFFVKQDPSDQSIAAGTYTISAIKAPF